MDLNNENIIPIVVLDSCILLKNHYSSSDIEHISELFNTHKGFIVVPQIIIDEINESFSTTIKEYNTVMANKIPRFISRSDIYKEFIKNTNDIYSNRFKDLIRKLETQIIIKYEGEITEKAAKRTIRKKPPSHKKCEFKDCLIIETLIYTSIKYKNEHNKIYFITENHNDFDIKIPEFKDECNLHNIIFLNSINDFFKEKDKFVKKDQDIKTLKPINYYDLFQELYEDLKDGESLIVHDVKEYINDCIIDKIGDFLTFTVENVSTENFNVEEFGLFKDTNKMECCVSEEYSFNGYTEDFHYKEFHYGKIVIFGLCLIDENENIGEFYDINYDGFEINVERDDDYDRYYDK
ncbi:PIN domain-containing protein [Fluviispira sanaruensis]|uniref:DUF4935 domain-containing protein n=1 Tax=Fluviispira sanaruensis TaxID=2493639 RepID=A0A4P2VYB6_FLUSA|nr:PIN domain-containing protein [Fluviispira sanaruensis]BBH54685.1 hypothetical protein JCM31447_31590 [Fluviispira sanaruensis]